MRVTITIPIPEDTSRVMDAMRDPVVRHARIEGDATLVLELEERALEERALEPGDEPASAPRRRGGWPKGKPRGSRKPRAATTPTGGDAA